MTRTVVEQTLSEVNYIDWLIDYYSVRPYSKRHFKIDTEMREQ
jgi:hypothetical protein